MRGLILAILLAFGTGAAAQQGWPDLDALLFSNLTRSGHAEAGHWLPDSSDPATASRALGVAYEHIPGSAGSVSIAVGYFQKTRVGWSMIRPVQGLFGNSPRDPVFHNGAMDVTTTMLGPSDPRCCPTQVVRWRIDLISGMAQRLN